MTPDKEQAGTTWRPPVAGPQSGDGRRDQVDGAQEQAQPCGESAQRPRHAAPDLVAGVIAVEPCAGFGRRPPEPAQVASQRVQGAAVTSDLDGADHTAS